MPQLTLIGWLPATFCSIYSLSQYKSDRKVAALEKRIGQPAGA